jgi:hypothetical protein
MTISDNVIKFHIDLHHYLEHHAINFVYLLTPSRTANF